LILQLFLRLLPQRRFFPGLGFLVFHSCCPWVVLPGSRLRW
jgi:hypothetical protein